MAVSRTTPNIDYNYKMLSMSHIQAMLGSGVLVNDDMDTLVAYQQDEHHQVKSKLPLMRVLLGGVSMAGFSLILLKKLPFSCLPIAASPVVLISAQKLLQMLYEKKQRSNMKILLETIKRTTKLDKSICSYFNAKNIPRAPAAAIFNTVTPAMKSLLNVVFEEHMCMFHALQGFIKASVASVPFLKDDYAHLELALVDRFTTANIDSLEGCIDYIQRVHDTYLLLASACVALIGVTLSPKIWTEFNINVEEILDITIPQLKQVLEQGFQNSYKKFDDVRFYKLNTPEPEKPVFDIPGYKASTLKTKTVNMIIASADIYEKAHIIYKLLQQDALKNKKTKQCLAACVYDLRKQVYDCYAGLDILYKTYEIDINGPQPATQPKQGESMEISIEVLPSNGNVRDASLNPSMPTQDEEYELYIDGNEPSGIQHPVDDFEGQAESRRYAAILSQELKMKLESNKRFAAAATKRKIRIPLEQQEADLQELEDASNNKSAKVPPPPPPPPLNVGPHGDMPGPSCPIGSEFVQSVKAAVELRQVEEDVYGDEVCDE